MIDNLPFADATVAVLGLGRSGLAAAQALMASDADVWAWDDDEDMRHQAGQFGVPLVNLHTCDWHDPEILVLSPGIPHSFPQPHPVVNLARQAACEIVGDNELLARANSVATYIGITGTNGKSTTTALIGHILHHAGRKAEVGGNLGVPVMELRFLGDDGVYVLEMSSFQLELAPSMVFEVAVLLNISPDHLERHGSMAGYIAAKEAIFHCQQKTATAVIGVDDDYSRAIFDKLQANTALRVIGVCASRPVAKGVYVVDGVLYDDTGDMALSVLELANVQTLGGQHNGQNAAAAYAVARAIGIDTPTITSAISSYPGLPHRQERIAAVDGIVYVNDSKATNAAAAARALACYNNIYWIAGGHPKDDSLNVLDEHLGRVRHAFFIGEGEDIFADTFAGKVAFTRSGDLPTAFSQACDKAMSERLKDAVVLLSPACSSYDQFKNFAERGDVFRDLVAQLRVANDVGGCL